MNALATEGLFAHGFAPAEQDAIIPEQDLSNEQVDHLFAGIIEGLEYTVPAEVKTDSEFTHRTKGGMPGELQPEGWGGPF